MSKVVTDAEFVSAIREKEDGKNKNKKTANKKVADFADNVAGTAESTDDLADVADNASEDGLVDFD